MNFLSIKEKMNFKKRVYNNRSDFFNDLFFFFRNIPNFIKSIYKKRINAAFREKLMVAASAVLDCKYCSWLHTEIALSKGVGKEEIKKILGKEIGKFSEDEAVALIFAQHYSERGGRPEKKAEERFYKYYGEEKARDILNYIRAIYFGNLAGNTVDAFLSRIKGKPAEGGNIWNELIVFLILSPYFFVILPIVASIHHFLYWIKK